MAQFATLATNFNPERAVAASHAPDPFAPAIEYTIDAAQRTILFWDVMRQRGNQYHQDMAEAAPHAPQL